MNQITISDRLAVFKDAAPVDEKTDLGRLKILRAIDNLVALAEDLSLSLTRGDSYSTMTERADELSDAAVDLYMMIQTSANID